jgi:ABC-type transport system substrate-binding protein
LTVRLKLPTTTFHDGQPANAEVVRTILSQRLPQTLGPAFDDIADIRTVSDREILFSLKRPSAFLLESLDIPIDEPGSKSAVGTGAFLVNRNADDEIELRANAKYHGARPNFDRIIFRRYNSMRSAFAALALFNTRRPLLRETGFRQSLNAAIDRQGLVAELFQGHATSADSPVWPRHWAYAPQLPRFGYQPRRVRDGQRAVELKCVFPDYSSFERMGLALQRQLKAVGVDLQLEQVTAEQWFARAEAGDFDLLLGDFNIGPPTHAYWFWHSGGQVNYGAFKSKSVDTALDAIRHARNDAEYKAGFATLDKAIVDDPPAIFLVWTHRISAVSRKFLVPDDGRDVVSTIRFWRPANDERASNRN